MTEQTSDPTVQVPVLREQNGYATYSAWAYLRIDDPTTAPTTRSEQGVLMTAENINVTFSETMDGVGWKVERVSAEGRYAFTTDGGALLVTEVAQQASWTGSSALPPWLSAIVDQLRPVAPPPGSTDDSVRRAALALGELPLTSLVALHEAGRHVLTMLDAVNGSPEVREHLIRGRRALLALLEEKRAIERERGNVTRLPEVGQRHA